jgi:hypothetical protein
MGVQKSNIGHRYKSFRYKRLKLLWSYLSVEGQKGLTEYDGIIFTALFGEF